MSVHVPPWLRIGWLAASFCFAAEADADSSPSEWHNQRGESFRAAPVEALGPYALFGPEAKTNRIIKFRALSPEECVRFHHAVAPRPPRAARWTEAAGRLTREMRGRVRPVPGESGPSGDLASMPEPELLLIFFHTSRASAEGGLALDPIMDSFEPFARRVRQAYPGRVEVVVALAEPDRGGRPGTDAWMTADPEQLAEIDALRGFMRTVTSGLLLITREGVPIASGALRDVLGLARILDHASALLWDLNPENRRTLPDRAHYLRAIRPTQSAAGAAPAQMLANPVSLDRLRALGIEQLDARMEIDADGRVMAVTLRSTPEVPAGVVEGLGSAIRGSDVFLPAFQDGKPVPGALDASIVVPAPSEPRFAAETAWVQGEARVTVPIASWLVLRPIRVKERLFTTVNQVRSDGTILLNPITAGTAQLDSFHDNWFDRRGGAAGVQPVIGGEQEVGNVKLVWQRIRPMDGFVDLARGIDDTDYSVGYAWTEVESPYDSDAWLGVGSDDGLKIWVNGRLVADSWVVRPSRLDDDVVPFRLRAGKNQILLKVQNQTGAWSFIARLRIRDQ